jgi:hypothetical protein
MASATSGPWPGNRVDGGAVPRLALVLPGRGYTVAHPLLHWTCRALSEDGWFVQAVSWDAEDLTADRAGEFVAGAAVQASDRAPRADTTLVVGKSLGTFAAGWATGRGWPGVWLTPLLDLPEITQPLRAAARDGIQGLLVGGTADPSWNGAVARELGLPVHEVHGANHSLEMASGWSDSVESVRVAVSAVARFAATL